MTLDYELNQFIMRIPLSEISHDMPLDLVRRRLVAYTIAQVAAFQLHGSFDDPASIQKCLDAAQSVVTSIGLAGNVGEWKFIDPIIAVCMM